MATDDDLLKMIDDMLALPDEELEAKLRETMAAVAERNPEAITQAGHILDEEPELLERLFGVRCSPGLIERITTVLRRVSAALAERPTKLH